MSVDKEIRVEILSKIPHVAQIISGFHLLKKEYRIDFVDCTEKNKYSYMPIVSVHYNGLKIIYDMLDGYQYKDEILEYYKLCDVYFKRSFSIEKNIKYGLVEKMQPLGFNYYFTYLGSPVNYEPIWKSILKPFLGKTPETYYTSKRFEGKAKKHGENLKILFLTRLWDVNETSSIKLKEERNYINEMRLEIIRRLREKYKAQVIAGLQNDIVSQRMASDLIMPSHFTDRRKYISLMHEADICIGSMGLHESIGWKTGEYIAAAKAIVNEEFRYQVPGNFLRGENYLPFKTVKECLDAVDFLMNSPEKCFEMKQKNEIYYRSYLRPDILVKNSLFNAKKTVKIDENERKTT